MNQTNDIDSSIVFINHDGILSQNDIHSMTEALETDMEENELNIGKITNIATVFIEMSQNILNYSKSEKDHCCNISSSGLILVSKNEDNYCIQSQNIICAKDKDKIKAKLIEIDSLDKNGIKSKYRELRKNGRNTHSKGGGIGFYEIAKRCDRMDYGFIKLSEDRFIFHFKTKINSSKN